jgi:hypothetical protein
MAADKRVDENLIVNGTFEMRRPWRGALTESVQQFQAPASIMPAASRKWPSYEAPGSSRSL